jgi:glycosyltransferase involved in cell wall biosynthesis
VGGPAKHTILLSKNLNNKNYRTVLVGGTSKAIEKSLVENARKEGIDCVIIPEMAREIHFYDDFISLIKLFQLIKKEKPFIFHSHTAKAGGIGRIAAFLAGVPIIFHTFHGHVFSGYFGSVKTSFFIYIERFLALISNKLIVISERQKNDIIHKFRIAKKNKVELIKLGFDWKEKFLCKSNFSLRNKYHIPKDKYLIGIIGRLVPIKDHRLFIEIAEKLISESRNNFYFIIIGDGELKSELIQVVKEKNINSFFTFAGWIEVNKCVYNELDILLLTSLNEGTPVTVIESLAAGTPVIARDVGGVADVMTHYKLEYLVKERNPAKFVELIKKIRMNSDKPLKVTQDKIMEIYSSERLVRDIKSLYERSLKNVYKFNSEIKL